jgi:hypothetical protein
MTELERAKIKQKIKTLSKALCLVEGVLLEGYPSNALSNSCYELTKEINLLQGKLNDN